MAAANTFPLDHTTDFSEHEYPYIEGLKKIQHAYPELKAFVKNIQKRNDEGHKIVRKQFLDRFGRLPGRCALLKFNERGVESHEFLRPEHLDAYLTKHPPLTSIDNDEEQRRLWILEDLEPAWIDVLGLRLNVDPRVFSEQMSTWNFTDSKTIPTRLPPSMVKPKSFFTLRYYEFRRLAYADAISSLHNQMTFAINRRRYERWRDVDTTSFPNKWRHAFVRRCASFWTNQAESLKSWDAVMCVDPSFDSMEWRGPIPMPPPTSPSPSPSQTESATKSSRAVEDHNKESQKGKKIIRGCTILLDPASYANVSQMWAGRSMEDEGRVEPAPDTTKPYHKGSTTLADVSLLFRALHGDTNRNLSSPLDEIVYHWTQLADQSLISSTRQHSVNTAHYLLKYLSTKWMHQLDLIACGIAQSEYFADDHEANINSDMPRDFFKKELQTITETTKDMNYMKRQINHFERAMTLNLERLGVVLGAVAINDSTPQAIRDAQMDFIAIHARLQPFCDRVAGLSDMANNLANLHMAFKSIKDSEFSLRLSLLGSIVFPATLVASLLSMGDEYRAGQSQFWVFWAAAVPVVLIFAVALTYGRAPEKWLAKLYKERSKARKVMKDEGIETRKIDEEG